MKIVIAGATGLIGTLLTKALLDSEHSIVVLTRNTRGMSGYSHPLLRIVPWSGDSSGNWQSHISGAQAVINLSGESLGSGRWTSGRKQRLISSRINPTKALVEAIRSSPSGPGLLINASAVGYYGPVADAGVIEDHPAGSDFAGKLCVEWEKAATEAQNDGVRVVLIRSGIVLDPRGGALKKMLLPYRLFVGGPLGSGNQWLPWIHKEDEIRAICALLEDDRISGPVNFVAPETVTMREFSASLGRVLRRPSIVRVPASILKILLGEMSDIVLTGQRALPQKLLQSGFKFRFPTLRGALQDLLM